MSFKEKEWKLSYSSLEDNVVEDFLVPALKEAILYKRATAYFSSSSLLDLAVGIESLVKKGGHIQLIVSPYLEGLEQAAIQEGYRKRDQKENQKAFRKAMDELLEGTFYEPQNEVEKEQYNLLAHLIEEGTLDIKVAVVKSTPQVGLFHDKIGLLYDELGNVVSFSGSMNETHAGMKVNHETINVFSSLDGDGRRIQDLATRFDRYWNNTEPTLEVFDFPQHFLQKLAPYKKDFINWRVVERAYHSKPEKTYSFRKPAIPESVILRPYQEAAIDKWKENGYCGFFDMATGTGKTLTALSAVVRILDYLKKPLSIIIVVPYIHLVTQWKKDLNRFGIQTIEGFSNSKQKNWKEDYRLKTRQLNRSLRPYVCLITTNASFRTPSVQELINQTTAEKLLIVDEAHNFTGPNLFKMLDDRFTYRLALSATLGDFRDPKIEALYTYFSPVCISYSLEQAIQEGMLVPYEYYPIPVYLTLEEQEDYDILSAKIARLIERDRYGNPKLDATGRIKFKPEAKFLLIQRAQIVAGAIQKLLALKELIPTLRRKDHLLVYCGATMVDAKEIGFTGPSDGEIRQIGAVASILRDDFDLSTAVYTSKESLKEREDIIQGFNEGKIQAIAAIRCLDEGVDIPTVYQAILLASSTNPKEYIQRRGRILRRAPGKGLAILYDFVTLPAQSEFWGSLDYSEEKDNLGLIQRELRRVREFGQSSLNNYTALQFIDTIKENYENLDFDFFRKEDD